jgi:hypothetical protein
MESEVTVRPGGSEQHPQVGWCHVNLTLDGSTVFLGKVPGRTYVSHQRVTDLPIETWWQPVDPADLYAFPGQRPPSDDTAFPVLLFRRSSGDILVRWL